jgi:putative Ca2+/H+ antiporter (TMEM165/GDT1 family)
VEAFLLSTGLVALAEMGDKTQLLALVLAARYRRSVPIVLGILIATLANHALAAALGAWMTTVLGKETLRWILGLSFIAMGVWTLIPDKLAQEPSKHLRWGVFGVTLVAFFLVEMGDKTQAATIALAAQYSSFTPVLAGTTLGMMAANVPVVLLGEKLIRKISVRRVQLIAAVIFVILGFLALF